MIIPLSHPKAAGLSLPSARAVRDKAVVASDGCLLRILFIGIVVCLPVISPGPVLIKTCFRNSEKVQTRLRVNRYGAELLPLQSFLRYWILPGKKKGPSNTDMIAPIMLTLETPFNHSDRNLNLTQICRSVSVPLVRCGLQESWPQSHSTLGGRPGYTRCQSITAVNPLPRSLKPPNRPSHWS